MTVSKSAGLNNVTVKLSGQMEISHCYFFNFDTFTSSPVNRPHVMSNVAHLIQVYS